MFEDKDTIPMADRLREQLMDSIGTIGVAAAGERISGLQPNFEGLNVTEEEKDWGNGLVAEVARMPLIAEANQALLEAGDRETLNHEYRVAVSTAIMVRRAGYVDMVHDAVVAALAHDNFKGHMQDIYRKPGAWTTDERRRNEQHPVESANTLKSLGVENEFILYLVDQHHDELVEKPERGVRPYGGNRIMLPAGDMGHRWRVIKQIFTRCDHLDANTQPRVYRPAGTAPLRVIAEMANDLTAPLDEVDQLFKGLLPAVAAA